MKSKILVLMICLMPLMFFAQPGPFNVEYYKIDGKLGSKDLTRKNFGRYDGFQLPLNKGELAYFILYSDQFLPSIVLITPGNEIYKQVNSKGEEFVATGITVPETGEWVLYVRGDSSARGDYFLQYGFTDSTSLELNNSADFCTGLNFLLAHANAYFIFPQSIPSKKPLYKLEGAIDAFLNGDDASYTASFYHGNELKKAEAAFAAVMHKIEQCISDKNWKEEISAWHEGDSGLEKQTVWTEKKANEKRIVELTFTDLSKAEDADYPDIYNVDLVIYKQ